MEKKFFGTDGIRGRANEHPITCEIAVKVGKAIGRFLKNSSRKKLVIGRDTRISGGMLVAALSAGASSAGVDVVQVGIIPTPGIAFLCQALKLDAGVVISASHNEYQDNGIKLFKKGGYKLSDAQERFFEKNILSPSDVSRVDPGKISFLSNGLDMYVKFLISKLPIRKPRRKLKLVIDCSNGAASKIAERVFKCPLFDTKIIFNHPNGYNINDKCGSEHTAALKNKVLALKADAGFAFDGDADRLMVIDEKGKQHTGDTILTICAKYAKENHGLKNNVVVNTIMSGFGFKEALKSLKIKHIETDVGDRNIVEAMLEHGAVIGGEDSGHMIFLDDHTTGDGMLSAIRLLAVMRETGKPISELSRAMRVYPRKLEAVHVGALRPDWTAIKPISDAVQKIEHKIGDNGRVLIRYSGTQKVLRVLVEGLDQNTVDKDCRYLCNTLSHHM